MVGGQLVRGRPLLAAACTASRSSAQIGQPPGGRSVSGYCTPQRRRSRQARRPSTRRRPYRCAAPLPAGLRVLRRRLPDVVGERYSRTPAKRSPPPLLDGGAGKSLRPLSTAWSVSIPAAARMPRIDSSTDSGERSVWRRADRPARDRRGPGAGAGAVPHRTDPRPRSTAEPRHRRWRGVPRLVLEPSDCGRAPPALRMLAGSKRSTAARSAAATATPPTSRPKIVTSRWSSRTTCSFDPGVSRHVPAGHNEWFGPTPSLTTG